MGNGLVFQVSSWRFMSIRHLLDEAKEYGIRPDTMLISPDLWPSVVLELAAVGSYPVRVERDDNPVSIHSVVMQMDDGPQSVARFSHVAA
jgi:hypothetical protein